VDWSVCSFVLSVKLYVVVFFTASLSLACIHCTCGYCRFSFVGLLLSCQNVREVHICCIPIYCTSVLARVSQPIALSESRSYFHLRDSIRNFSFNLCVPAYDVSAYYGRPPHCSESARYVLVLRMFLTFFPSFRRSISDVTIRYDTRV